MATVSYVWATDVLGFTLNGQTLGDQSDVAIAATADGGYLGAWSVGSAFVRGRYVAADGTPGVESDLNTTLVGNQFDASMALLGDGRNVISFTDSSSGADTVRIRILGEGTTGGDDDFAVPASDKPLRESDVAALGGGGFAVAYTRDYGAGDTDLLVQRYEADGDQIGGPMYVDNQFGLATDHASIAGLASGGFVVAWEQSAAAGGDHSVWFQLYDASGVPLTVAGDPPGSHHLIDDTGSINQDIQVAALQDGGFVVVYADNGWFGADGTEIAARVYNADGSARSGFIRVNDDATGNQLHPTVTVLSNGFFVVGWDRAGLFYTQAYDPSGVAIGTNHFVVNGVYEGEIVGLAGGLVANVSHSAITDGDGSSIQSSVEALVRDTIGTAANETLAGDGLRDVMDGAGGGDTLDGGGADDELLGGADNDILRGGAGADDLDGGTGTDTADYSTSAAAVTVSLAPGIGSSGDAAGDTLFDIENLTGSAGFDGLTGDDGINVLSGLAGNDMLRGSFGADTLNGGLDIDTVTYDETDVAVTVNLNTQQGVGGAAEGDSYIGIENVNGSQGSDSLTGNILANVLRGFGGNDVLRGIAGADTLDGGAGIDTVTYTETDVAVTVNLNTQQGAGGAAEGDSYIGIENVNGSQGSDSLTGNILANVLQGFSGNDVLRGIAGADTLDGGAGIDTVTYTEGNVGVTVSLNTQQGTGGGAEGDSYIGIENVNGSAGADTITGNILANVLNGWAGKDTMTGLAGADRFVFSATSHSVVGANADRITDFSHAQGDKIDLSAIDANAAAAGNQAFGFIGTGAYTGVAGQLHYAVSGGVTTIGGDLNGDKASDFYVTLTGSIALVAADFVL